MVKKLTDKRVDALMKDPSRVKRDFIANPNMDKLISVVLRLAMENTVLRDRIVRQEKILVNKGVLSAQDLEAYEPDKETAMESQMESFELIRAIINDLE